MDMRDIVRIGASNTARINLPMWLRSEPYRQTTHRHSEGFEVRQPGWSMDLCLGPTTDRQRETVFYNSFILLLVHTTPAAVKNTIDVVLAL